MGKIVWGFLFFLLWAVPVLATDFDYPYAAKQVVDSFLVQLDNAQYGDCWDQANPVFQANISREEWVRKMSSLRPLLGSNNQRIIKTIQPRTTLPGAPDGEYLFIVMDSFFEHKEKAVETIILKWDGICRWTFGGYFFR